MYKRQAISSGMGTCGLVGPIGVYTGWVSDVSSGAMVAITAFDWIGLILICFILPALLSWVFCQILRKIGWIKEGDLKLESADDIVKANAAEIENNKVKAAVTASSSVESKA